MLVFITGVAGSGKSALAGHLRSRGLRAQDADCGISRHVDAATGLPAQAPPRAGQTPQWAALHEFRFDLDRVSRLAESAGPHAPAFLLGAAYGDDEVVAIANRSFFLDLDEAELRRRLAARPAGSYGQEAHELESVLAWHAGAAERYEALGAVRLDAARPVGQIADELLGALGISAGDTRLP